MTSDIMEKKNTKVAPQIFAAVSATMIVVAAAFHGTWASPSLPKLLKDTFVPVTVSQSSWIVGLFLIGGIIGPLLSVVVVDRFGRKTSILATSIPLLLSSILIGFAQNYWWYYVARFICGIGSGATWTLIPMFIGEISEDRIRGSMGVLISVMTNFGQLIPLCVGPWISVPALAAVSAVIPIIFILTFTWIPETPYYYIMKDKPDNARKSLEWLRGTQDVDEEVESVKRAVEFDQKNKGTVKELITNKGNQKALIIQIALFSAQLNSGILVIANYSTVIFNEVVSDISSEITVILIGVVQLVVAIVTIYLADKAGRRTLLLISIFFTTIFLIGEGVYFHLKANGIDVSGISWLPVTVMVAYLCSYMIGLGTVPVAVMSEIFPCNVKAYATMIVITHFYTYATVLLLIYPIVTNAYGIHVAFYGFAIGTLSFFIFFYYYLPETRGKSLEDIQHILQGRSASKFELQEMIRK